VLCVLGPGLIGTSVILAARRAWPGLEVRTIDRGEPLDVARGADVIVLAAPVDIILATLPRLGLLVGERLIIDTGSTKRAVIAAARSAGLRRFVGGHPMAGGTTSGPAGARADLFDDRPWFLVGPDAPADARASARHFAEALGARVVEMDDRGEAHDHLMAAISHLPQLAANALMTVVAAAVGPEALRLAGPGLRDTTRLSASPSAMWLPILETNADEIGPLLKALAGRLDHLADRLTDRAEIGRLFDQAARARAACL
jgi:prephenate dehydrogenase